jgi:Zn-dependent protease
MIRFTLFGVPVRIEPWFWLLGVLFGSSRLDLRSTVGTTLFASWMIVWVVSFLIHEFGHALFQRRFGGHPEILLYGGGGLAMGNGYFSRWQSLTISAAGPVIEVLAGLVAWWALDYFQPPSLFAVALLRDFGWICVFWGLFNLLPVLPLDGGQILNALTGGKTRLVAGVGMVTAAAAALYCLPGLLFMAIYMGYYAWRNFETWRRGYRSESPLGDV